MDDLETVREAISYARYDENGNEDDTPIYVEATEALDRILAELAEAKGRSLVVDDIEAELDQACAEKDRALAALWRIRNLQPEWGESPVKKVSPTVEMARTIARQALSQSQEVV